MNFIIRIKSNEHQERITRIIQEYLNDNASFIITINVNVLCFAPYLHPEIRDNNSNNLLIPNDYWSG